MASLRDEPVSHARPRPRGERPSRIPIAGLAIGVLALAFFCGRAALAADPPALAESVNVREVELILEPPPVKQGVRDMRAGDFTPVPAPGAAARAPLPSLRGRADLGPADFLLLEDGKSRPILRLEPLGSGATNPWRMVLYFDLLLARSSTVSGAALALAAEADSLIALGTVDVVVADPEPRVLLARSREAGPIREILAAIAAKASHDPSARPFSAWPPPTPAALRRQCDRLTTSLVETATTGPRALLLVADSPQLSAPQLQLLSAVSVPGPAVAGPAAGAEPVPPGESPAVILGDTSRLLAAYGWLTLALPVHPLTGSPVPLGESDADRFRRESYDTPRTSMGQSILPLIVLFVQWMRGVKPPPPPDMRLVAPQLDMEFASLLELVRPTAGTVVTASAKLSPALQALGQRWHLWYQGDATPAGSERPVALSLLASAMDVRTTRWVRSSTPEALSAARLRRLLNGDAQPGSMTVRANLIAAPAAPAVPAIADGGVAAPSDPSAPISESPTAPPVIVLAQTAARKAADSAVPGPWRVSFAWTDAAGNALVTHHLLSPADADLWMREHRLRLPAPPAVSEPSGSAGRPKVAVLLEDLANESWGTTLVELPAPQPSPT